MNRIHTAPLLGGVVVAGCTHGDVGWPVAIEISKRLDAGAESVSREQIAIEASGLAADLLLRKHDRPHPLSSHAHSQCITMAACADDETILDWPPGFAS